MWPQPPTPQCQTRRDWVRTVAGCAGLGWVPAWGQASAPREGVPVLYPELGEPYRSVFSQIVAGIDERLAGRIDRLVLPAQGDPAALSNELQKRRPRVVLALGRAALRLALNLETEVVGSGIISPAEGDSRSAALLSLAPDPQLLFQRLRQLAPGVRRITLVYSQRHSGWLVQAARDAAKQLGLDLRPFEAEDLKTALHHYQDFFAQATAQDALWLPQDPSTVDEAAVLPLVIQESWNRSLVVFSSNLSHVRRGALFSLYPNNTELGRSLGNTALALLARTHPPRGPQPLRDVHAALNTRTASHLGMDLPLPLQRSYDLLLPER